MRKKGAAVSQETNGLEEEVESQMGVGGHAREGGRAITETIASIVRHK
jgi:hypothetical protein